MNEQHFDSPRSTSSFISSSSFNSNGDESSSGYSTSNAISDSNITLSTIANEHEQDLSKFQCQFFSSLSLLGRIPPLHLLMSAAIFLPGQALTRTLQMNYFISLDPGASGSVHLYSSVFGATASVILFYKVKVF